MSGTNEKLSIRRYLIIGERRFSNYWWTFVVFLGSCGFLFTGLSSYLNTSLSSQNTSGENTLAFFGSQSISFFPQGLLMSFYGSSQIHAELTFSKKEKSAILLSWAPNKAIAFCSTTKQFDIESR